MIIKTEASLALCTEIEEGPRGAKAQNISRPKRCRLPGKGRGLPRKRPGPEILEGPRGTEAESPECFIL